MKVREGDTVKVLYGKDSGKTGKVLNINSKTGKVVVEGVNLHRKHIKGDGQSKKSEVISITKSFPISKVMLIDPETGDPTRVGYDVSGGEKIRISKKTGKPIDEVTKKAPKEAKKKEAKKKTTSKKKPTKAKKSTNKKTKSTSKK